MKYPCKGLHRRTGFIFTAATALAVASVVRADPPGSGWQLAFADEFNGSSLDTIKWNYNYPWSQHGLADDSVEQASQVTLSGGLLYLTASNQGQWYNNNYYSYTSGAINTNGLENFTYGYYEASQKMPSQQGLWPAFWMLQNGWPPEIDIEEVPAFGTNPTSYSSGYHYTNSSGSSASAGPGFTNTGIDLSSSFNTYAVDWEPNSLTYYFNGSEVGSISGSQANIAQSAQQYLLLDLGVGGWPGNPPSGTYFPATMETDWVRVWQKPTSTLRTTFTGSGSTNTNWDDSNNWSNGSPDVGAEEAFFGPISGVTNLHVDWNAGSSGGSRTVGAITFQSSVNYTIGYSDKSIMLANTDGTCYINGYYQSGQGIMAIGCRLELYNNTIIDNYLNNPITLQAGVIGTGSLSIEDGGTNINGAATYTGATIVSAAGALVVNGSINGTSNLFLQQGTATIPVGGSINTASYTSIGQSAGNSGTLNISGGSLTVNSDFNVGDVSATGLVYISSGAVVAVDTLYVGKYGTSSGAVIQTGGVVAGNAGSNDWRIGGGGSSADSGAVGVYNLSGGTFSAPGNLQVGAFGTGTFIQTGGTVTVAAYLAIGRFSGGTGVYNMSTGNGVLNATYNLLVGEQGTGALLLGGTSVVNTNQLAIAVSDGGASTGVVTQTGGTMNAPSGVTIGINAGNSGTPAVTGTYNLYGGTLLTSSISQNSLSSISGYFNFSGGTLVATGNSTNFLQGLSKVVVQSGGAIINTNGFNITVAQALVSGGGKDGGLTKLGSGAMTLSNRNTYSGGTTVDAGLLIAADGLASVGSGTINLNGGGVIFRSTSAGAVNALLTSGYNSGSWTGTGIDSTAAADDLAHLHAVGMLQPSSAIPFEGQSLGTGDVAVKYTYYGDTNLDGKVDGSDYSVIDNDYLFNSNPANASDPLTGWQNGDFNYDGVIDGSDYTLMDDAFNRQGAVITEEVATSTAQIAGSSSPAGVPEPSAALLLAMPAMGLLGRRRPLRYQSAGTAILRPATC